MACFTHPHIWKHFDLSRCLNNRSWLAEATRLPNKMWLICQSLIESKLGKVPLLLNRFLTNSVLAFWAHDAYVCCTLALELLIEISVALFWSHPSLRLRRFPGVLSLIWLFSYGYTTNSGTTQGVRISVFCSLLACSLFFCIICFDQLMIKYARNTRCLKKTLVLLLVIWTYDQTLRSLLDCCLAGHSSNSGRWCGISWLCVAFRGLSPPNYHLHFLLLVLSYWKVLLFDCSYGNF